MKIEDFFLSFLKRKLDFNCSKAMQNCWVTSLKHKVRKCKFVKLKLVSFFLPPFTFRKKEEFISFSSLPSFSLTLSPSLSCLFLFGKKFASKVLLQYELSNFNNQKLQTVFFRFWDFLFIFSPLKFRLEVGWEKVPRGCKEFEHWIQIKTGNQHENKNRESAGK